MIATVLAFASATILLPAQPAAAGVSCQFDQVDVMPIEGDTGTADFGLTLNCSTGITGSYTTVDETAVAGADFVATSGDLDFSESTTAPLTIPIMGDTARETVETFLVRFSSDSSFTTEIQVTITDEDGRTNVALFAPEGYADLDGDTLDNMQGDLEDAGHTVTRITGIDASSIESGLAGQDAIVVANLENAFDLEEDMTDEAEAVIRQFVAAGRPLAISGTRSEEAPDWLNSVFGFALVNDGPADTDSFKDDESAAGTEFANGPDMLEELEHIATITVASMPEGSRPAYVFEEFAAAAVDPAADAAVSLLPFEDGSIAYLGWSWEDCCGVDGGWVAILDSAVELPDLTLTDVQVGEGDGATVDSSIVATISDPVFRNVSADFASADGTATAGSDYTTTSGNVEIPRTTTSASIPFVVRGDAEDEANEAFTVTVSNAQGVRILDSSAAVTIIDNDEPPAQTFTSGYRLVAGDGGIFTFGDRNFHGSTGSMTLNKPMVGGATDSSDYDGYWMVASDGGVFTFNAEFHGSLAGQTLSSPAVEIEPTPSGKGYWIVLADGKVYTFGDANHFGDMSGKALNKPVIGMSVTPSGKGYWLVAGDGGIFNFGDAGFFGSTGDMVLNAPIIDLGPSIDNNGYYLLGADGGVFTFGSADFKGSTGSMTLNSPVVAILVSPNGSGYWLAAADGGVFTFGSIPFLGSMGGIKLNSPVLDFIN